MATKKKRVDKDKGLLGVGIVSAVIGALGTYFLYGSNKGAKRRSNVRGWMLKAKGEVLHEVEKLKDIDEKRYNAIAKKVLAKYKRLKSVGAKEFALLSKDIEKAWKEIEKEATGKRKTRKK